MSSVLGKFVRRILDSETGPRSLWIVCQSKTMKSVQLLEVRQLATRGALPSEIQDQEAAIRSSTFFSSLFAMSMRRSVVSTSRMYSRLETIRLSSSRSAGALPWEVVNSPQAVAGQGRSPPGNSTCKPRQFVAIRHVPRAGTERSSLSIAAMTVSRVGQLLAS